MSKPISEKVQELYPDFAKEVANKDVDALNTTLLNLAKGAVDNQLAQEADEALAQAKAEAKEFGAPYRDIKKAIRLKSHYLRQLISEKGGI